MRRRWINIRRLAYCVCVIFCASCANFSEAGGVENYAEWLKEFTAFPKTLAYEPPEIEGFTPFVRYGFDFATPFFGEYAFVVYEGTNLLLNRDGTFYYARENLLGKDIAADKFIFESDGLLGVKSVFGEVLVRAQYDKVQILGGCIAGTAAARADLYRKTGETYQKLHEKLAGDVALFSEDAVLYNGKLCDLELKPLTVSGYDIVSETRGGMRVIADGGALFGYASDDGTVAIPPVYREAGQFQASGYAYVVDFSGAYHIIDTSGQRIYSEQDGKKPVRFDGTHLTFMRNGYFDIADRDFRPLTDERFVSLYEWSVYDGILVYNPPDTAHRFYTLAENRFIGYYEKITPIGGYFVAKTLAGIYAIFDARLNEVIDESHYIDFDGAILLVGQNGAYHFYAAAP